MVSVAQNRTQRALAVGVVFWVSNFRSLRSCVNGERPTKRQIKNRVDLTDAAKALGVEAILIGRVTQRGENLSISVELVNASDRTQMWGEQYDRKMSDLLVIQREITSEIVDKLKLKVSGAEKATARYYTESNEAYQLYLKGRFHWNKRTAEALKKAIENFNQAIEKDPSFSLAYAGLADWTLFPQTG